MNREECLAIIYLLTGIPSFRQIGFVKPNRVFNRKRLSKDLSKSKRKFNKEVGHHVFDVVDILCIIRSNQDVPENFP